MSKKRFTPEEIIGRLRHADVLLGQGKKVAEIVKALGITDVTHYRWRQEFGRMSFAHVKRLNELERENGQLWKVVGDLTLDKLILEIPNSANSGDTILNSRLRARECRESRSAMRHISCS